MTRILDAAIIGQGDAIQLRFAGGRSARFHALWLLDNAPEDWARSPGNGQRLRTVLELPAAASLADAGIESGGSHLRATFGPDGVTARYPAAFLAERIYDTAGQTAPGWTGPAIERWDGALATALPTFAYAAVRSSPAVLRDWLAAVRRRGFALLTGAPAATGTVIAAAELFGFVRETNYGRAFDVRAEVSPSNLAYTSLGLQAHTDNPYRDPVPTLQLLACLENSVAGGESIVVDGFRAAEILQRQTPDGFALLASHCARFEYAGARGVCLRAKRPMIELGPDGELLAVRFNNRSIAALTDVPFDLMPAFYDAYRQLARIVEDPENEVVFRLTPGDLFIVDNTRVLHARRPFSGSGSRWLQGCYADKDGLLSTLCALEGDVREHAA